MSDNKPRAEVEWFAKQMEQALRRKDEMYDGNSWWNARIDRLIDFLEDHVRKLKSRFEERRSAQQLIYDAADIGNFAMMIADVANMSLEKIPDSIRLTGTEASILGYLAKTRAKEDLTEEVKAQLSAPALLIAQILIGELWNAGSAEQRAAESFLGWANKPGNYRVVIEPDPNSNIDYYLNPPWQMSDDDFEKLTGAKWTVRSGAVDEQDLTLAGQKMKEELDKEASIRFYEDPPLAWREEDIQKLLNGASQPLTEEEKVVLKNGGFNLEPLPDEHEVDHMKELCANSYTTSEVALLMGIDEARVNFYRGEKSLYGFLWENCWFFPKVQFEEDRPLPKLDLILKVVRPEVSPLGFMGWLQNPDPDLYLTDEEDKPMSPLQWLRRGGPIKGLRALAKEL